MRKQPQQEAAGFTLTEAAIVVGAFGLILGAIWAVAGSVWDSYRIGQMQQQTLTVAQNVRDYYMSRNRIPCATGNEITALLDDNDRRLIPTEMRAERDQEGQDIHHAAAAVSGGSFRVYCLQDGSAFRITLDGLEKDDCVRLLMRFPVLMPELGIKNVVRPGGTVESVNLLDIETPATGYPMNMTTASNWCGSTTNEVSFDFKLRQ